MAELSLEHICKKYPNGYEAVKDFNLEIADKEFIIFVGPSGCGKSTTLRMIAGLEDISSGSLKIDGKEVNNVESKDRDIAMVFQNYALYPHMTVYKNMAFALKLRKASKQEIDKAVREAARILDLEQVLKRKPSQLSGGQRQRVAMGRAMVRSPKVFLMDEPLSNLDAKLRVQMRTEIAKLHERLGATIIYVTHDQTEAMTLGTRIVVMKDGVIQQCDTPSNLYNAPDNLFVAGFIGSPQMNFIDANVVETNNGVELMIDNKSIKIPAEKGQVLKDNGYVGKTVVMGIRPENIYFSNSDTNKKLSVPFSATVGVSELLGSEVLLYFDFAGTSVTAKISQSYKINIGDNIEFAFDIDKIHVFDKETEQAIVH
jgi:multiple sugar transport system ATP-binding protein